MAHAVKPKWLVGLLFVALLFCAVAWAGDGEPKFKNPAPTFKPLDAQTEKAVIEAKLRQEPRLSAKEKDKVDKGKIVIREMERKGEARRFEAVAKIDAPPAKIMKLMRSFDRHVGVMPHLKKVEARWLGSNLAEVTQTLSIALSTYRYTLNVYHYGSYYIEWEYLSGDLKDTSGFYKFFPIDGGQRTMIVYHVFTDPGIPIPEFIMNLVTKSSMPKVIEAIRGQMESKTEQSE
jgi:hypothetical protein